MESQGPPIQIFPANFAPENGISMSSYKSKTRPLAFHLTRRYFSSLVQPFFLVCVADSFLTLWLPRGPLFSGPLNSGQFNISVLNTLLTIYFDLSPPAGTSLLLLKVRGTESALLILFRGTPPYIQQLSARHSIGDSYIQLGSDWSPLVLLLRSWTSWAFLRYWNQNMDL